MKFTEKEIDNLIDGVYRGEIDVYSLPVDLYTAIADYLKKGLYDGFGGSLIDFSGKPLELLEELRENVYMFSGAKTFQQVKEMTDALINEEGVRSFKDFKAEAQRIYQQYNVDYLRTEYDTAIASGQQGYLWKKIEADADLFPYLKFTAVMDKNTTDECRHMNDVCAPVTDKIWNTCYPPNHWHCRSSVLQISDPSLLSSDKNIAHARKETEKEMQDVFKMNVGKDGYVFSPEHPYFEVAKKDVAFAKRNFDLPLPDKD